MRLIINIAIGILNFLYRIFKIFPQKNKVLMISRQSDSISLDFKLLQEELHKQNEQIQIDILCKKIPSGILGKLGYCFHMLKQMQKMAQAKVVVLDSYCILASLLKHRDSTKIIQIWHALGSMKKFGKSIIGMGEGASERLVSLMHMHENYDMIIASCRESCKNFAEAFGYDEKYVKIMSLPRVDAILSQEAKQNRAGKIYKKYPYLKDKKIVLYAPTLRKNKDISTDINHLIEVFEKSQYQLVVKVHPLTIGNIEYQNAIHDEEFTTLDMLYISDYVITDYSAMMYEVALARKPMWFYAFDLDEYLDERNFYIDYRNIVPGNIIYTAEDVLKDIENENYSLDKVEEFANRFVENQVHCTLELAEVILNYM